MEPTMAKRTLLSCLLVASTACAGDRESQSTTAMPDEISAAEPADDGPPKAERPAVSLQPSMHPSQMTEVVLDALGRAAITLDANGEVRLWPDLLAEAVSVPYALPVQEPVWMSLA